MGHAYHSNHLVWFEMGRTELLRSLGHTYREWEDDRGVYLPVRRAEVHYLLPVLYDDLVVVDTAVVGLTRLSLTFSYELKRPADGASLALGETEHVFIDKAGKILRNAPALLPELFGQ